MRRGAARGHQRGAHTHERRALALQAVQGFEQGFERAAGQRRASVGGLVRLKGRQPLALVDPFGFVGEQHGVAVEGDAHLVRVGVAGVHRQRVHLRGGHAGVERGAHVGQVGREEQVGAQRAQVAPGRLAAREAAALDGQAVVLRRAEHAHARDRVVAREDHHLDPLGRGVVEGQQLVHQRKRHPRLRRLLQPVQLQLHVSPVVASLEQAVFFFKVEQRPRRNRDHQLTIECCSHG
ncbi:hypothetical protein FQZ97_912210 [compost metagenome]